MGSPRKVGHAHSLGAKKTLLFTSGDKDTANNPDVVELQKFQSRQVPDPFSGFYKSSKGGRVLQEPPYSPQALLKLPNQNSTLRQCMDAYVVNIEGHGHRFEFIGKDEEQGSAAAEEELARLSSLADQPNEEYSLVELRQRVRRDIETFGYGFIEVGRDTDGEVAMLYHALAQTIRLTDRDAVPTPVERKINRNGKLVAKTVMRYFRRYAQMVGSSLVYFKEFGDPRPIDPKTGAVNENLPIEEQATELYHLPLYSSGEVYGLPRWISQLPSVLGTRESELTNLQFFKENAIPAMAILVSGGMLTEGSVDNIENHITSTRGRQSMHRVMVLEATGDEEAASEKGQIPAPKVDIKPLTDSRQSDGTFQTYERNGQLNIRSAFRLPPIFIGLTEDMTHATASASLSVAEAQVFGPERAKMDAMFNTRLFLSDGEMPKYWRFRSNPPRITNPEDVIQAIGALNEVGAMTPNVAIGLGNEVFDLSIPPIEEDWGNQPFLVASAPKEEDASKKQINVKRRPRPLGLK